MYRFSLSFVVCIAVVLFKFGTTSVERCAEKDGRYKCPDIKVNCTQRIDDCTVNPCNEITSCDETRYDGPMCCVEYINCGNCMAVFYCNNKEVDCFGGK